MPPVASQDNERGQPLSGGLSAQYYRTQLEQLQVASKNFRELVKKNTVETSRAKVALEDELAKLQEFHGQTCRESQAMRVKNTAYLRRLETPARLMMPWDLRREADVLSARVDELRAALEAHASEAFEASVASEADNDICAVCCDQAASRVTCRRCTKWWCSPGCSAEIRTSCPFCRTEL